MLAAKGRTRPVWLGTWHSRTHSSTFCILTILCGTDSASDRHPSSPVPPTPAYSPPTPINPRWPSHTRPRTLRRFSNKGTSFTETAKERFFTSGGCSYLKVRNTIFKKVVREFLNGLVLPSLFHPFLASLFPFNCTFERYGVLLHTSNVFKCRSHWQRSLYTSFPPPNEASGFWPFLLNLDT